MKEYLDNHKDDEDFLFSLAFLFGSKSIRGIESWHYLGQRFFETYSEQIHAYCGYDAGALEVEKICLASPDLFLLYMGAMVRAGVMGDCSFLKLSACLDMIFKMGESKNTVLNKLKEQNPEFSFLVDRMDMKKRK